MNDIYWFFAHGAVIMMWGQPVSVCLFLAGWWCCWWWRVLRRGSAYVGGGWGGGGWMKPPAHPNVQRGSDQCHTIVPLWQSGRIAVSLPAQWQTRLSWEWREALFCHAKSLKPSSSSSFRRRNPQSWVRASAAQRWQSQSRRTHGPGSLELRSAVPKTRGDARHTFFFLCEKDLKPWFKGFFPNPFRAFSLSPNVAICSMSSWSSSRRAVYCCQSTIRRSSSSWPVAATCKFRPINDSYLLITSHHGA